MPTSLTPQQNALTTSMPLPWRPMKPTPLHHQLGKRAMRFYYPGAKPITGTNPQVFNLRYGPENGIDRIVGFSINSFGAPTLASGTFVMQELATNWSFTRLITNVNSMWAQGNVETMADEVNLQWSFSADPGVPVYLAFYNFEIAPFSAII